MNRLPSLTTFLALLSLTVSAAAQPKRSATPADQLKVAPGFKVELIKSATDREGSWVSMAVDTKGRLYVSPQQACPEGGLVRITLDDKGQVAKTEWPPLKVSGAMGMLWAFDSLYFSGDGPAGRGIYRLRDTNGDDALDDVKLFKKVPGGAGEHGTHALVLAPDGKSIFVVSGNSTPLIDGIAPDSPYRNYQEDHLLPRIKDPVATFFDNLKVPYGYVLKTDENGTKWELFAGGMRNTYDIDFNADGELFAFDSDMEWDIGLPWYRPTRVLHVTSGAEYGFREGDTKWPDYYPDSLPAVVNVGLSSPTGVKFGTRSNFPGKYRSAFFLCDWTFGRIVAVHMKPKGSTYSAENALPNAYSLSAPNASADVEEFLSGKGMPLADIEFGNDGAMYAIVGGRGTQSGLYRISSTALDAEGGKLDLRSDGNAPDKRASRRKLEQFHGTTNESALAVAWPELAASDRFLRYAARLAVEGQPVGHWQEKALNEQDPRAAMAALLALVRVGDKESQPLLLKRLGAFPVASLPDDLKLEKLRVIQLSFIRHGRPATELAQMGIEKLSKSYPANSFALNRELSQILAYLDAPDVVGKTLSLMRSATDPAEQIWYANVLRVATHWTPEQRRQYFEWFNTAATFKGMGNSAPKFILRIREEALKNVPEAEKAALAGVLEAKPLPTGPLQPAVKRDFKKAYTMADLEAGLDKVGAKDRDFARGKEIFASTNCLGCHKFGTEGGGVGPDITAVSGRFSRRDVLLSIVEPSKAISEQYAAFVITDKKGLRHAGQISEENNDNIKLITDPLTGASELINQMNVKEKRISPVSTMPTGLIDVLSPDEVYDLLAYIETGGKGK